MRQALRIFVATIALTALQVDLVQAAQSDGAVASEFKRHSKSHHPTAAENEQKAKALADEEVALKARENDLKVKEEAEVQKQADIAAEQERIAQQAAAKPKSKGLFEVFKHDTSVTPAPSRDQPNAVAQEQLQGQINNKKTQSIASDALPKWEPLIDSKGTDQKRYAVDLQECKTYAINARGTNGGQEARKSAKKWGLLAIAGTGIITVATGGLALLPLMGGTMAVEGGGMAAAGALTGKTVADNKYKSIVVNCLASRGYNVIGD
jgi:hypothetical protein